jgi:hypothetical protein
MFESGAIFGDVLDVLNKMKEHFDLVYSIWNGHYGDKLCSTPALYSKEFKPRFMQWCEVRARTIHEATRVLIMQEMLFYLLGTHSTKFVPNTDTVFLFWIFCKFLPNEKK